MKDGSQADKKMWTDNLNLAPFSKTEVKNNVFVLLWSHKDTQTKEEKHNEVTTYLGSIDDEHNMTKYSSVLGSLK